MSVCLSVNGREQGCVSPDEPNAKSRRFESRGNNEAQTQEAAHHTPCPLIHPHLVSVFHQITQQVVHVQDPSFNILQVVGLHCDLPMLDAKTPVSKNDTFTLGLHNRLDNQHYGNIFYS